MDSLPGNCLGFQQQVQSNRTYWSTALLWHEPFCHPGVSRMVQKPLQTVHGIHELVDKQAAWLSFFSLKHNSSCGNFNL